MLCFVITITKLILQQKDVTNEGENVKTKCFDGVLN